MRESWAVSNLKDADEVEGRVLSLRTISDPEILTRVILVEDLSHVLIESFGSAFKIDPEFFAEHLNRSGYSGVDYYDASPMHWETHNMSKAHACVKWYKVVQQNPKVTEWLKNPSTLLDWTLVGKGENERRVPGSIVKQDPAFDASGRPNMSRMEHQYSVDCNIFRRGWPLSTRPATQGDNMSRAKTERRSFYESAVPKTPFIPTAWEEKATFFLYDGAYAPISAYFRKPIPNVIEGLLT